jgi:hypothetical protein
MDMFDVEVAINTDIETAEALLTTLGLSSYPTSDPCVDELAGYSVAAVDVASFVRTELCVRDESQVLPLGYFVIASMDEDEDEDTGADCDSSTSTSTNSDRDSSFWRPSGSTNSDPVSMADLTSAVMEERGIDEEPKAMDQANKDVSASSISSSMSTRMFSFWRELEYTGRKSEAASPGDGTQGTVRNSSHTRDRSLSLGMGFRSEDEVRAVENPLHCVLQATPPQNDAVSPRNSTSAPASSPAPIAPLKRLSLQKQQLETGIVSGGNDRKGNMKARGERKSTVL